MMLSDSKQRATEVLAHLIALFPRCFFVWGYQRRPIKIGVFNDLRPLVSFADDDLKAVLRRYTLSDGYLRASTEGSVRIDLDGNAAGAVTAKEAAWAQKVLAERENRRAKKKAASEQQAAGSQRGENTPLARPCSRAAGRCCETGAAANRTQPAKDGDGFAALRAAAARRRESAGGAA
jgi:sRNA-binding protein